MRPIDTKRTILLLGFAVLFAAHSRSEAGPVTTFNSSVNQWTSSTFPDHANGIFPIGGAGQRNGGFVVTTGSDGAPGPTH